MVEMMKDFSLRLIRMRQKKEGRPVLDHTPIGKVKLLY